MAQDEDPGRQPFPSAPGAPGSPRDILEWLRGCSHGGVHVMTTPRVSYRSWQEVLADVSAVADHFASCGVDREMRVGIRGHNSYEWMILDLALLAIGATPVALPVPEFTGERNGDLAERFHLSASFVDRSVWDPADGDAVVPLDSLLSFPAVRPGSRRRPRAGSDGRSAFTLAFSSGTAGRLKCLLVSWSGCARLIEAAGAAYHFQPSDRILVSLPLSTFQQRYLVYLAIRNDFDVILTTSGRFLTALEAGKPTIMLGPPNFYEFAAARFSGENRRLHRDVLAAAAALIPLATLGRRWRRFIFRSAHRLYGGSVRLMLVGSAPIQPGVLHFFARAGFPLCQIYGMTETGFLSWNTPAANKIGSVGRPVYPGTTYCGPDGEVLIRHSWHLCYGYEGEPDEEAGKVFRAADVIATGDVGEFDRDGFLYLRGRKKNIIITPGGQKIQLEDLEKDLSTAAGVSQAVVFMTGSPGRLACVAWFAGDAAIAGGSLRQQIGRVNARLALDLRIQQAALVEGELDEQSSFLNRNLKLNRDAVSRVMVDQLRPLDQLPGKSVPASPASHGGGES